MQDFIEQTGTRVRLEEGNHVIERLLLSCYFDPGIATKELARRTLLPVPVAAAIKKELIRAGALIQKNGVQCTSEAREWIEQVRGYSGLNKLFYLEIMEISMDDLSGHPVLAEILAILEDIFRMRPQVNVQIDQSKCTPETSLRRAVHWPYFGDRKPRKSAYSLPSLGLAAASPEQIVSEIRLLFYRSTLHAARHELVCFPGNYRLEETEGAADLFVLCPQVT